MALSRFGGVVLCACLVSTPLCAEERHADHEALRAILKRGAEALNTGNFDAMAPFLHSQFTIVTVDNQKFTTLDAFRTYWNGLFKGEKRMLDKIETNPVADDLTRFLAEDVGVTHGVSSDTYHFRDGDVRKMQVRWTAVVAREGGVWKLVKLHMSSNLLDNPVLDAVRQTATRTAALAGGAALALGVLLGYLLGRRRRA